jgi:hypothetical protein
LADIIGHYWHQHLLDSFAMENVERFINTFVHKIDLEQSGFELKPMKEESGPLFNHEVIMIYNINHSLT